MLKAYAYCLDDFVVIDRGSNTMYLTYPWAVISEREPEKIRRITKATIEKFRRDRGFVLSPFILNEYAPEELTAWEAEKADRGFIGAFEDRASLRSFIVGLYEKTRPIRDQYHFVNFGFSLWEVVTAIRRGKTEQDFNKYGNKYENDLALFRVLCA